MLLAIGRILHRGGHNERQGLLRAFTDGVCAGSLKLPCTQSCGCKVQAWSLYKSLQQQKVLAHVGHLCSRGCGLSLRKTWTGKKLVLQTMTTLWLPQERNSVTDHGNSCNSTKATDQHIMELFQNRGLTMLHIDSLNMHNCDINNCKQLRCVSGERCPAGSWFSSLCQLLVNSLKRFIEFPKV